MVKDLFFLYYLLSYSSGILALFLSAYLYFNSRDPLLKKYIVLMSLFFAFISINAAANYVPDSAAYSGFKTAMSWIILAACCPMIYLLPEFMASVFRVSFKKKGRHGFFMLRNRVEYPADCPLSSRTHAACLCDNFGPAFAFYRIQPLDKRISCPEKSGKPPV